MTEREQLEKIKREVQALSDQRQLLLLQVHELEMKKKYADLASGEAVKKQAELEITIAGIEKDALEKAASITASAQVKESNATNFQKTLTHWEKELAQKEQDQFSLSKSLDNKMLELVDERKRFEKERSQQLAKADTILENAKQVADEKLSALSRENTKNAALVSELTLRQEAITVSLAGMQELRASLDKDRNEIKDAWEAIKLKVLALESRENDAGATLGRARAMQDELDRRAASISAMERGNHERASALDLRQREVDLLGKKVQSLINIHKLEAEIASHS